MCAGAECGADGRMCGIWGIKFGSIFWFWTIAPNGLLLLEWRSIGET